MCYINKLSNKFAFLLMDNADPNDEIFVFLEYIAGAMVNFDFEEESENFRIDMGSDRNDFPNETKYKSEVIHHFLFNYIKNKKDHLDNKTIYQKYIYEEFKNNICCLLDQYIKVGLFNEIKLFEKFIGTINSSGYI